MNKLTIKTNNVPRNLIYGYELTDSEKQEFDYVDNIDSHDFFRYKGVVYDPSQFMRIWENDHVREVDDKTELPDQPAFSNWDGYHGDSYFSGVLIRYIDESVAGDCDQIIVGRYYS